MTEIGILKEGLFPLFKLKNIYSNFLEFNWVCPSDGLEKLSLLINYL